jgi:hypothetical protein
MTPVLHPIIVPQPRATGAALPPYNSGLARGALMTDAECIRFYNGMVSACASAAFSFATCSASARSRIPAMMDVLAEHGLVATVGYAGTAIIRPLASPAARQAHYTIKEA